MFIHRLEEFIHFKNLSLYAFENSIQASRGSISKAIKHEKSIGTNVVENILKEYPELNPNWLFTGKGEMILKEATATDDVLDGVDKINIIKHINDNLEEYKKIRSFHLLLESAKSEDELSIVKSDIETLKKKIEEIMRSK